MSLSQKKLWHQSNQTVRNRVADGSKIWIVALLVGHCTSGKRSIGQIGTTFTKIVILTESDCAM